MLKRFPFFKSENSEPFASFILQKGIERKSLATNGFMDTKSRTTASKQRWCDPDVGRPTVDKGS